MPNSENRIVHLDLKGCPLKLDYLEKLFPVLSEWGATGLLVEWEDTFPYSGQLAPLPSPAASYTLSEVQRIHSLAANSNLSVIPLVQTFGHFEFVLKHAQFEELREVSQYPASLCPSHPLSLPLITEMLDQVIKATPSARYIHIGADEVWHLGVCPQCSTRPKSEVYLSHVIRILHHLHTRHKHLKPLLWDDMLRNMDQNVLLESKIGELVEPVVWHYQAASTFSLPEDIWAKYGTVFSNIWFASAYKGATGSCQLLPVVMHHVSNHQQWLCTSEQIKAIIKHFAGIILTGWSRYDHYATLCELLPPSLPSLALCLRVWNNRNFDDKLLAAVSKELGYAEAPLPLNPYPRPQVIPQELTFPGWKLAVGVEWLANLRAKQAYLIDSDQVHTWLNPWQIENNFTNPMQIESLYHAFNELEKEWNSLEEYLCQHLPEVYFDKTITEWIGTLVAPCMLKLKKITENAKTQLFNAGCLKPS